MENDYIRFLGENSISLLILQEKSVLVLKFSPHQALCHKLNYDSNCKRLIIGGYSFPPTDFHMKHLFLEAFRENKLEELIVINPDSNIIKTAKELCHYRGQVKYYSDLKEFYCSYQT